MKTKKLIYSLSCPVTNQIHYIGKSTQGLLRPAQHLTTSHSVKIKEWVEDLKLLGHAPKITVVEYVSEMEDLDERERYWIQKELKKGSLLLNSMLVVPITIATDLDLLLDNHRPSHAHIGKTIKERRRLLKITQEDFASKAGVALTVVRKVEQGKTNLNLDSLLQLLSMFGLTLAVKRDTPKSQYNPGNEYPYNYPPI
jgi:y4mF family transcriptional regulator